MNENIKEVIERISYYDEKFPKDDLQFLIDNQAEATPILLDALENPEEVFEKSIEDQDYILSINALLLLAQFREEKAYPLVFELVSADKDKVDAAFRDFSTEDLHRVLASISGGDVTLINRLIENKDVDEYVRSAAIDSWLCLVRAGLKTREEAITYFKKLFSLMDKEGSFAPTALVHSSLELNAPELHSEIKRYYDNNRITLSFFKDWKEAEQVMLDGNSEFLEGNNKHYNLVTDALSDIEHYFYFEIPDTSQLFSALSSPAAAPPEFVWNSDRNGTFKHKTPKAGANDPCPCGSGRKYKKCCQNKK